MKDELTEKANKIFDLLINGIEGATDLAHSEAPIILKEYMELYFVQEIPFGSMAGGILVLALSIYLYRKFDSFKDQRRPLGAYKAGELTELAEYSGGLKIATVIFSLIFMTHIGWHIVDSAKNMYLIKNTPKAFMIEKFRR